MESLLHDVITERAVGLISSCTSRPTLDCLWDPITPGKIRAARLDLSIALELSVLGQGSYVRAVPVNVLVRILNSIIWCERLPNHLMDARTIFILKKFDAVEPADFRPITIFSALARLFHLILSRELVALWSSKKSRGHSWQPSMVAETTEFSLIPTFCSR